MRILLQDCETRRYLAPGGAWSESVEAALEFEDLAKARDYGSAHGLSAVRVVALAGRAGAGTHPRASKSPKLRLDVLSPLSTTRSGGS